MRERRGGKRERGKGGERERGKGGEREKGCERERGVRERESAREKKVCRLYQHVPIFLLTEPLFCYARQRVCCGLFNNLKHITLGIVNTSCVLHTCSAQRCILRVSYGILGLGGGKNIEWCRYRGFCRVSGQFKGPFPPACATRNQCNHTNLLIFLKIYLGRRNYPSVPLCFLSLY